MAGSGPGRVLRATNLLYLNDASEGVLGITLIKDLAQRELRAASGVDLQFLNRLLYWLESPMLYETGVYVLCFSQLGDDLSQWRGYTPHGRGIALGIDIGILVSRMQQLGAGWTFQNCRYTTEAQQSWANAILTRLRRLAAAQHDPYKRNEHFDLTIGGNLEGVLQTAALMKDQAFAGEQELRFISPRLRQDDPRIKFRAAKSTIIPYIDFSLVLDAGASLPAANVVIGPGPTQRLTHAAVSYAMVRYGFARGVNYRPSPIPYREL